METCPNCKTVLEGLYFRGPIRIRRSRGFPNETKEHLFSYCKQCESQYFTIRKMGEIGKWRLSRINSRDLTTQLTDEEFIAIKNQMESISDLEETETEINWTYFMLHLNRADEIWHYELELENSTEKGIAIKQGKYVITEFSM